MFDKAGDIGEPEGFNEQEDLDKSKDFDVLVGLDFDEVDDFDDMDAAIELEDFDSFCCCKPDNVDGSENPFDSTMFEELDELIKSEHIGELSDCFNGVCVCESKE